MRKIFTLLALLAVCFGAKAEVVEDYKIDYSQYDSFPFYVMGYTPEFVDGVMRSSNPMNEAGEPAWYQYFVADGIPTEEGKTYTVTVKIKASETVSFNLNMGWGWGEGQQIGQTITATTEWKEVSLKYSEVGGTSCNLVAQPGISTATIEWAWLKVTHDTGAAEAQWVNCLMNGDAEGAYATDFPCAIAKVNAGSEKGAVLPARVINENGNKVFVVKAGAMEEFAWDNQFWIQTPMALKAGDKAKVTFRYKAAKPAKASTQQHSTPGNYQHWACIGDVNFTTEWQTFETKAFTVNNDGFQSIAFNLNELTEANTYYFDDIELLVDPANNPIPEQTAGNMPVEGVEAYKAYDAVAETMSIGGQWGISGLAGIRNIKVEGYDDNSIIVRGFMGAEGYDLKIDLNVTVDETGEESQELAGVTPIINGVAGETVTNGWLTTKTGSSKYHTAQIYAVPGYGGAWTDAEEGYVLLQGYFIDEDGQQNFDYYYAQWPQTLVFTLDEIKNITDADDLEGNGYIYAKVKVDNAKVTYYDYDEDYQEITGFMEDESGAAQLWYEEPVEGIEQGNTLTGMLDAFIFTGNHAIYVIGFDGEVGTANVKKGRTITSLEQIADPENAYRLVTVNYTNATPIINDPDLGFGLTLSENIFVADMFGALDYDYEFPESVMSVTGIVYPYDMNVMNADEDVDDDFGMGGMMYFILPRSAADIVATPEIPTQVENAVTENSKKAAIFNLAGQKVNANFKGIIVKDGKKVMVK